MNSQFDADQGEWISRPIAREEYHLLFTPSSKKSRRYSWRYEDGINLNWTRVAVQAEPAPTTAHNFHKATSKHQYPLHPLQKPQP